MRLKLSNDSCFRRVMAIDKSFGGIDNIFVVTAIRITAKGGEMVELLLPCSRKWKAMSVSAKEVNKS